MFGAHVFPFPIRHRNLEWNGCLSLSPRGGKVRFKVILAFPSFHGISVAKYGHHVGLASAGVPSLYIKLLRRGFAFPSPHPCMPFSLQNMRAFKVCGCGLSITTCQPSPHLS